MQALGNREPQASTRLDPFRSFYDAYVGFVWQMARRFGVAGAEADDVVQRSFLVAYRRLPEFRPNRPSEEAAIRAWLFGIVFRVVRDHRRTVRRKGPYPLYPGADPETLVDAHGLGPHDAVVRRQTVLLVRRLLDELDCERREVLVLAKLEYLSNSEIADTLGIEESTVASRLKRARRDFRRAAMRHHLVDTWRLG
jgi:RNA polymerase sigma-70 factor (ECF subfamily)